VQLGFPMSVYGQDPFGLLDVIFGSGNRANLTGNPVGPKTVKEWFNTSAYTQSAVAHYGTSGRNVVRSPGINDWDLNLAKTFVFTERLRLEFRAEAFNLFNHPQYYFPDSTITDAGYGQISSTRLDAREIQFGLKLLF